MKRGLLVWGKNIHYKCFKTEYSEKYWDIKVLNNLGYWIQGDCYGLNMWLEWGRQGMQTKPFRKSLG